MTTEREDDNEPATSPPPLAIHPPRRLMFRVHRTRPTRTSRKRPTIRTLTRRPRRQHGQAAHNQPESTLMSRQASETSSGIGRELDESRDQRQVTQAERGRTDGRSTLASVFLRCETHAVPM